MAAYKWYCSHCQRVVKGDKPYLENICPYCQNPEFRPLFPLNLSRQPKK